MKTKIKVTALLICLMLIVSVATGCSSIEKLKNKFASDKLSNDDFSVSQKTESDADDPEDDPDTIALDDYKVEVQSDSENTNEYISIEQQDLFDKEKIKISALDYYQNGESGDEITLFIENNSDKDVTLYSDVVLVNGFYSNESTLYTSVAAGEQGFGFLYINLHKYEKQCIGNPGEIEMYITARDDNYDYLFSYEYIRLCTSAYTGEKAEMILPSKEIMNINDVKIDYVDIEKEDGGYYVYFYIENNTDSGMMLLVADVTVNGQEIQADATDALFFATYSAKSKGMSRMLIYPEAVENYGIDFIETIEIKFGGVDITTYEPIVVSDTITIITDDKQ